MQQTIFINKHKAANAKLVEFCGYEMPINYGSQIHEHEMVRTDAGMFDVSHMVITDVSGSDSRSYLRYLISNDVAKLEKIGIGKALYSAMLNHNAGIIDDLIVYLMPFGYRIVSNAGTRDKVTKWLHEVAQNYNVQLSQRNDLSILAVQGPNAIASFSHIVPEISEQLLNLKPFTAIEHQDVFYARTGYTGEDGLEVIIPNNKAELFWDNLLKAGVKPCGLGSRDTLRLEAGMNLYGHEMDDSINPTQCNMEWVVDLKDETRDFIGKAKYLEFLKNKSQKLVGLVMQGRGVLRGEQKIYQNDKYVGVVTSGTFSPSLKQSIAMARVDSNVSGNLTVEIRGSFEKVLLVSIPFVRFNKKVYQIIGD